ncbi:hypothetical protein FA13DRAFT_1731421 [Coprinellus micaceus]|uniref:Uncharacterized protein n=1 Tax=Coprinellus micaceus TaxID=71717 RepID=A0A4Y7TFG3_COPMI|nr:hypothetical protein FA13DRAFT_1731421 [Coprinellus micaceus]
MPTPVHRASPPAPPRTPARKQTGASPKMHGGGKEPCAPRGASDYAFLAPPPQTPAKKKKAVVERSEGGKEPVSAPRSAVDYAFLPTPLQTPEKQETASEILAELGKEFRALRVAVDYAFPPTYPRTPATKESTLAIAKGVKKQASASRGAVGHAFLPTPLQTPAKRGTAPAAVRGKEPIDYAFPPIPLQIVAKKKLTAKLPSPAGKARRSTKAAAGKEECEAGGKGMEAAHSFHLDHSPETPPPSPSPPPTLVQQVPSKESVKVILSRVTWSHIQSFGIQRRPVEPWSKEEVQQVYEFYAQESLGDDNSGSDLHHASAKWEKISQSVVDSCKALILHANPQCEFYARNFIDHFILHLSSLPEKRIRFFQGYTLSAEPQKSEIALKQTIEHLADLKAQLQNPAELTHNDFRLKVTGHVDYAIFTMPSSDEMRFRGLQDQPPSSLDKTVIELNLTERRNILLLPIEAKAQGLKLEGEIRQILAEGLIILKKTGRKTTSWCLSNGCEWIFGITHIYTSQDGLASRPQYYSLTIDPLWDKHEGALDFESESPPQSGSREGAAMKRLASQAEVVWQLLNLWAFVDPVQLMLRFCD